MDELQEKICALVHALALVSAAPEWAVKRRTIQYQDCFYSRVMFLSIRARGAVR